MTTSREEFEEQIKLRLTSNANEFDGIVIDMLKEIERLQAEAERWKRSNDVASQLFDKMRVDNERLNARVKELEKHIAIYVRENEIEIQIGEGAPSFALDSDAVKYFCAIYHDRHN